MINKVTLIGNLGRDPEVRHLESGAVVARLAVATNENYRDKAGEWQTLTEWHNVVLWGPAAENAERNLKKGSMVYVEGKLTTRKWQDKDGNERYTTEVRGLTFRSLDRRETAPLQGGGFPGATPAAPSNPTPSNATDMSKDIPSSDDDLPF